jgi:hypothetical protein
MEDMKKVLRGWFVGVVSTVAVLAVDPVEGGRAIGTLLVLAGPLVVLQWLDERRNR